MNKVIYKNFSYENELQARTAVMLDRMETYWEHNILHASDGLSVHSFHIPSLYTDILSEPNTPEGRMNFVKIANNNLSISDDSVRRIVIISDIPDIKMSVGLWHFPAMFLFDGRVRIGWWYFEDNIYCDEGIMGQISSELFNNKYEWHGSTLPKTDCMIRGYSSEVFNYDVVNRAYDLARRAKFNEEHHD